MRGAAHQLLFVAVLHCRQVRQVLGFVLLCLDVRRAVKLSRGAQQNAEKIHTAASHGARLTQISFLCWPTSLPQQHGASLSILLYTAEESRNRVSCDVAGGLSRGSNSVPVGHLRRSPVAFLSSTLIHISVCRS